MRALSMTQPWGWLVVQPEDEFKDIENRVWNTKHRGEFLIHAAKKCTEEDYESCLSWMKSRFGGAWYKIVTDRLPPWDKLERGGIIGSARIVDVIPPYTLGPRPPWHMMDKYGFVLEDRKPLPFVPCAGALNFWNVPDAVERAVREAA